MNKIQTSSIWKIGEYKKHYFSVSEVMKEYFGDRFNFDASESTTNELMYNLKNKVDNDMFKRIENYFLKLDIVKFTDTIPIDTDSKNIAPEGIDIIRLTSKKRV